MEPDGKAGEQRMDRMNRDSLSSETVLLMR
jgi:hypothetical protein